MSTSVLDLNTLNELVRSFVALRAVTEMQPAGGVGDKVFPPTYATEKNATTKYAFEERHIDGRTVKTVLLDSVASQANRMELSLLDAFREGELELPVLAVDFSQTPELEDIHEITTLEAPHRVADAIFRDSYYQGKLFRYSDLGKSFVDAKPSFATPLYRACPHALVFGIWDSTGPKGGLGAKFARLMTSEIVGLDATAGVKTSSRIDPLGIQKQAGVVYVAADQEEGWTLQESAAQRDKNKVVKKGDGAPSEIVHGNIAPSLETTAGGVTVSKAVRTAVFSLAGLRQLRFPTNVKGELLQGDALRNGQHSARVVLAALALVALAHSHRVGYDLRSRALLVPTEPLRLQALPADGSDATSFTLSPENALDLYRKALKQAQDQGFGFDLKHEILKPTDKLAHLVRESRKLAAKQGDKKEE